jgi:hypothetical protein
MKIKVKVLKQAAVYEEVELTFPFYKANSDMFYYKIINETNVTQVIINKHAYYNGIENLKIIPDMASNLTSIEITEQEFEAKFNECIELLTNLKNQRT